MRFLLGNARFMAGKYGEATADYKKYLTELVRGLLRRGLAEEGFVVETAAG